MLDFRYLTFLKLCEIMNYTKTADALHITQPAVTQHIKFLENLYCCKLFSLKGKTLSITDNGKRLLEYVKRMHSDSLIILESIKSDDSSKAITFGATLSIGEFIMPKIIKALINDGIKVKMIVENTETLLLKLQNGELNFALIEGTFDKSKYGYKLLKNEDFVGVCSKKSNLAENSVTIESLLKNNLILREKGSGTRDVFERALKSKNLSIDSFKNVIEIGNINVIKDLVYNDLGISFMYRCAVDDNLVILEIEDFSIKHEFNFVYLKESVLENEYIENYNLLIKNLD